MAIFFNKSPDNASNLINKFPLLVLSNEHKSITYLSYLRTHLWRARNILFFYVYKFQIYLIARILHRFFTCTYSPSKNHSKNHNIDGRERINISFYFSSWRVTKHILKKAKFFSTLYLSLLKARSLKSTNEEDQLFFWRTQ